MEARHGALPGQVRPAAALLGQSPPGYHGRIVTAGAPAFVAIDGPLYNSGPIRRIETVSPRGRARATSTSGR